MPAGASPRISIRLRIVGRVQGVGYRAWAVQAARRLGLSGWVRNLSDGAVEALAYGDEARTSAFIAACQAGPPMARVSDVRTVAREVEPAAPPEGFQQLPTL